MTPTPTNVSEGLEQLRELLAAASPGPWTLKVHTGDGSTIGPKDDWTVLDADENGVCFEGQDNPQAEANARLIPAAVNFLRDNLASPEVEQMARRFYEARHAADGRPHLSWDDAQTGASPYVAELRMFASIALSPPLPSLEVERLSREQLEPIVYQAALKWCGEKERETFPEDIEYFKHNWSALPGLRSYVERELALSALPPLEDRRE